jgi:mannitol-1-/sugar-/sorbitol-6-phosphatase
MTPSALLLDLDGTLIDSEPMHRAAYRAYFDVRGWPYDEALLSRFTGRRADDVFATDPGPWAGENPAALRDAVVAHVDPNVRPEPVPGGKELIAAAAAAGVLLAIVTSATLDWVELTIDLLGVRQLVDIVVTRDDVREGKPDPMCYRHACEQLNAAPAHAIAVEDSPAGVAAAVAAHVGRVYGVTTTWPADALKEAGVAGVFKDLRSLVTVVES